jgi:hypothetical protein
MVRPRPRTVAIAAAVLLPVCGWGWMQREARLETQRRAAQAAALVAGRPVQVRCPGILRRHFEYDINDGEVRFGPDGRPGDVADLAGAPCDGLHRLISEGPALDLSCLQLDACSAQDTRVALGVIVLTHEAVHLSGIADEALTECRALQRSPQVAMALGATRQAAGDIQDWQFSVADDRLPDRYQTPGGCRLTAG